MVNEPTGKSAGTSLPEMAQLAKLLMKMGPDIDRIARVSGQYKETIRYRYKEKILGKGFALHAKVNFEGLGLRRVVMKVKLSDVYAQYSKELFLTMNKLCYVTSFTKLLPEGTYMMHANVPKVYREKFIAFMSRLKEMGMFDAIEFYNFDWFRNIPMRAEFYDFEHGIWDFNWTKMVEPGDDDTGEQFEPLTFDRLDLLILKELQGDATRSLSEIRESIKTNDGIDVNYKTLAWHWARHVQEKRMVQGYTLKWMGTNYDQVNDRAKHRQHKYVMIPVFVRKTTEMERMSLITELNRIPFLWCEAGGEDYHAQLAFPVEMMNDAFSFLHTVMAPFGDRASYHIMDQANSIGFTFPYQLFDDQKKEWAFADQELLARFESLIMKIKEGSGANRN